MNTLKLKNIFFGTALSLVGLFSLKAGQVDITTTQRGSFKIDWNKEELSQGWLAGENVKQEDIETVTISDISKIGMAAFMAFLNLMSVTIQGKNQNLIKVHSTSVLR